MGWNRNGICGWGDKPPAAANQCSGLLIVLGAAAGVWDDVRRLKQDLSPGPCAHLAVNAIGMFWPGELAHWVTLHPDYMVPWRGVRRAYRQIDEPGIVTHAFGHPSQKRWPGIDCYWDMDFGGGCSGMFGCCVGLACGYSRIILCGMPMDDSPYFFGDHENRNKVFLQHSETCAWQTAIDRFFNGRVRSMSGRTRIWCGEPTKEWIQNG
jgi:hypothetical protein